MKCAEEKALLREAEYVKSKCSEYIMPHFNLPTDANKYE